MAGIAFAGAALSSLTGCPVEVSDVPVLAGDVVFLVLPSKDVLLMRDWFQMVGLAATDVLAEVVDLHAFGDRADEVFVGDTVGVQHDLGIFLPAESDIQDSVPTGHLAPGVVPASLTVLDDSGEDALLPGCDACFCGCVSGESWHIHTLAGGA